MDELERALRRTGVAIVRPVNDEGCGRPSTSRYHPVVRLMSVTCREIWPGLPGLQAVRDQLAARVAVLQVEQARREAGIEARSPAWKNLVFAGGPGTGKSRAAAAVARSYRDLATLWVGDSARQSSAGCREK